MIIVALVIAPTFFIIPLTFRLHKFFTLAILIRMCQHSPPHPPHPTPVRHVSVVILAACQSGIIQIRLYLRDSFYFYCNISPVYK